MSTEKPGAGGISFGGGSENEYVREFERQRDSALNSGGTYDLIREEILSIRPRGAGAPENEEDVPAPSFVPAGKTVPSSPAPASGETAQQGFRLPENLQPYLHAAEQRKNVPQEKREQAAVTEPENGNNGFSFSYDEETPAPENPSEEEDPSASPGRFASVFSEDRFLSVSLLIAGIVSLLFSVVHIVVYGIRASMFSNSEALMAARGIASYTLNFSSPVLGFLKFLLFLVPIGAVLFTVALKLADGKGLGYNKKTVIAVLSVVLFAGVMAALDVAVTHLLF